MAFSKSMFSLSINCCKRLQNFRLESSSGSDSITAGFSNASKNEDIFGPGKDDRMTVKQSKNVSAEENFFGIKSYLLHDLGISSRDVETCVTDFPEVLALNPSIIKQHVQTFTSYAFDYNHIKTLFKENPWIFLTPPERISLCLKALCRIEITRSELHSLCLYSPCVLVDEADVTMQKYDYLHFLMGQRDYTEMFQSSIFKCSLAHIQERHTFLQRRGQYILRNRHGSSGIENPSLTEIFCTPSREFCERVAKCDENEYALYRKLFAHEERFRDDEIKNSENQTVDDLESDHDVRNNFADELLKNI